MLRQIWIYCVLFMPFDFSFPYPSKIDYLCSWFSVYLRWEFFWSWEGNLFRTKAWSTMNWSHHLLLFLTIRIKTMELTWISLTIYLCYSVLAFVITKTCISISQSLKVQPKFVLWANLWVFARYRHLIWSILYPSISSKLLPILLSHTMIYMWHSFEMDESNYIHLLKLLKCICNLWHVHSNPKENYWNCDLLWVLRCRRRAGALWRLLAQQRLLTGAPSPIARCNNETVNLVACEGWEKPCCLSRWMDGCVQISTTLC